MNKLEEKTDREILSSLQRGAEVFFIVCMLLLFGFLLYHQIANTGFFTAKFGPLEMLCLYGPLLLGLTAPAVRALTGERNPARPFEAATSLFLAVGSLWLLIVFPLNYAHLADTLPGAIRFVLAWVTDDIARVVLILQFIIGPISALTTIWKYWSVRQHETESYLKQRTL
jgi:hypothetical protein